MRRASCITSIMHEAILDQYGTVHSFFAEICKNHEIHPQNFNFIDVTNPVTRPSDIGPMIGCVTGVPLCLAFVKSKKKLVNSIQCRIQYRIYSILQC
jgi:hypothetical protein